MRQFLSVALASVAVAAPAPGPRAHSIAFAGRSLHNADGTVNEAALLRNLNRTLIKYNAPGLVNLPSALTNILSKRGDVPLTDQFQGSEDDLYYGPAKVAGQTFQIDFDTGSSDFFIPGPNCGSAQGCVNNAKYDNSGQDQHKTTTVTYGSGQISGEDYKDSTECGGFTVPAQGFISLTDASGFANSQADGLMGMGFSTIANTGFKTFFENVMAQGDAPANEFSFYLGRGISNTASQSELFLGGRDQSKFSGTPKAVPVTKKGYWQVALDDVKVNGNSAGPTTKGQAAIDTGTTIVLGPTAAVAAVAANIPGMIPIPLGGGVSPITLFAFPCNTDAKLIPQITFAGTDFAINPLDYNLGPLDASSGLFSVMGSQENVSDAQGASGFCIAGLGAADLDPTQNLYVVGDVFLKNWYSIYNYDGPSVSFAPATGNNKGTSGY